MYQPKYLLWQAVLSVYVRTYIVCIRMCMYICVCTYVYVCVCTYVYVRTYVYVCVYSVLYVCERGRIRTY